MKRVSKTRRKPLTGIGRLRIGLSLAWLFVVLLLLFAGSCTQTDVEEDVIPPHALKDVDAGFNLNVLANRTPVTRSITFTTDGTIESDTLAVGVKDSVQTKAAAALSEAQESQIASLWVGQYDATTGVRLFNQYISSMTSTTVNLKLKQSQNGSKSHVYFVSNAGDLGAVADETTLKKQRLPYASSGTGLPENSLCKMVGKWEGEVVAGGVKDITVELTRLLAKISFCYSMGADFTFTPTSVTLKNAPSVSQVEAPTGQLTKDVTYGNYTGTASSSGATVYWYLPENMAGTVSGPDAVVSEKKKTGKGVTNATCIELTGNAVQGGVTYKDVMFRFYPGRNENNYDIERNSHYTMNVTLVGIDVSDERITVGEIPDIEVDPTEMPAKKGGEKEIQITARPGQEWIFDMPAWLSALLDGKDIPSGATITYQGPAKVVFKSVEANPRAEKRSVSFDIEVNGENQNITITQSGSTLTVGSPVSLAATAGSEGASSFTATEGLQWSAVLGGGDGWLDWATNPGTSAGEALAGAQELQVKAGSANPSAQVRTGKITVKAGASVGDPAYTGLKQEIAVNQAGSTVTGSTINNIVAKGATGDASFMATKGLPWASSITSGNWITINTGGAGTPTTGAAQTINYTAVVNPSSSARSGKITVRAGDTSAGPTGDIVLNQLGATLSVSGAKTVAATASTTDYVSTFSATEGLSWNVSENMDWLTLTGTTEGTNNTTGTNQDIKYSVGLNPNETSRNGNITVKAGNAVGGTDAGLTKTIAITQSASSLTASVSPTTALVATTGASGTYTMNGTSGLSYSFTAGFPSWLTVTNGSASISGGTTSGSNQQLTYKTASVNPNSAERKATVTVKAGNISKSVEIKQAGSSFSRTNPSGQIAAAANSKVTGSVTATAGLAWAIAPATHNGITVSPTSGTGNATITFTGAANTGAERTGSFTLSASGASPTRTLAFSATQAAGETGAYVGNLQVCKTDGGSMNWSSANSYCSNLTAEGKSDWYLPSKDQLVTMYNNKTALQGESGFTAFVSRYYWSSTANGSGYHWVVYFSNGGAYNYNDNYSRYVRCVRDKN
nr:BACON domain-containing carbohydrate-binding protein [Parabacteroides goldsteinii]